MKITVTLNSDGSPCVDIQDENAATLIGEQLRKERAVAGLTRAELARLSGVTVKGLYQIEKGKTEKPRSDTIQKIRQAIQAYASDKTAA